VKHSRIIKLPAAGLDQNLAATQAIGVALVASVALTGVLAVRACRRRNRAADVTTAEAHMEPQPVVY
jgi:hypothetical protein